MELLQDFVVAVQLETWEGFEDALAKFDRLKEVRGNGTVEIGFLTKVIKQIGLGVGQALVAAPVKMRQRWLKRLVENEKAATRCMGCLVLGEIGKVDPEAIVFNAYKLAKDERWEVRECIANAFDDQIGLAHPEFVYDLMSQWVADANPNVRRVPTNALMRYGIKNQRRVIALMNTLRHDDSEYVRKNVKFCLQQIAKEKHPILGKGNPDNPDVMLETLTDWAQDTEPYNRWIVASTLGNVWAKGRLPQAMALLKTLATDEDKQVRSAVTTAMRELGKQDAAVVRAEAAQWAADANAYIRTSGEKILTKVD
jgi:3-methyladenine DNA glycosylase AlkC